MLDLGPTMLCSINTCSGGFAHICNVAPFTSNVAETRSVLTCTTVHAIRVTALPLPVLNSNLESSTQTFSFVCAVQAWCRFCL